MSRPAGKEEEARGFDTIEGFLSQYSQMYKMKFSEDLYKKLQELA